MKGAKELYDNLICTQFPPQSPGRAAALQNPTTKTPIKPQFNGPLTVHNKHRQGILHEE
jgi:hypothetical protein